MALGIRYLLALRLVVVAVAVVPASLAAQTHDSPAGHDDPVAPVVPALAIILAAAKLAGTWPFACDSLRCSASSSPAWRSVASTSADRNRPKRA